MANIINGKPLRIVATRAWDSKYGGIEAIEYIRLMVQALQKKPVDMLVFEMADESNLQVRSAGYDLPTDSVLDEKTIIIGPEGSLHIDTFWFKIDNYGDHYVGTFLFPSDY